VLLLSGPIAPSNPFIKVGMDPQSSLSADNHYCDILRQNEGLLLSDAVLLTTAHSAKLVEHFRSMKKVAAIEVLSAHSCVLFR